MSWWNRNTKPTRLCRTKNLNLKLKRLAKFLSAFRPKEVKTDITLKRITQASDTYG